MTLVAFTLLTLTTLGPTELPALGEATYYNPGVMEAVYQYRRETGTVPECSDCLGAVAMLSPADLGRKVWIAQLGGVPTGPYIVADCAAPQHIARLQARGWLIDLPYDLAMQWGMAGPIQVTVWDQASWCNDIWRYQTAKQDLEPCAN